jgi:hypothetical protein
MGVVNTLCRSTVGDDEDYRDYKVFLKFLIIIMESLLLPE